MVVSVQRVQSISRARGFMDRGEFRVTEVMRSFTYDVHRATASLMFVLQGMEHVRNRELPKYDALPPVQQQDLVVSPTLPYLDLELWLSGAPFDPRDVLRREGEAEQLAFKGWVEQVYNTIWDGRYRRELKEFFGGPDVILPELDVLGDLRLLRNDLVHNHGVASAERTGKCVVLKWFEPGEPMILGMAHVFDFLNQMGMLSDFPVSNPEGAVSLWSKDSRSEDALRSGSVPHIVSLRVSTDRWFENGSSNHVVSVVFANGVYANVPVHYPAGGTSATERMELLYRTCLDSDGNLLSGNGQVVDRRLLYGQAIDVHFGKGQRIEGMGIPGPWVKFRRPESPTA